MQRSPQWSVRLERRSEPKKGHEDCLRLICRKRGCESKGLKGISIKYEIPWVQFKDYYDYWPKKKKIIMMSLLFRLCENLEKRWQKRQDSDRWRCQDGVLTRTRSCISSESNYGHSSTLFLPNIQYREYWTRPVHFFTSTVLRNWINQYWKSNWTSSYRNHP